MNFYNEKAALHRAYKRYKISGNLEWSYEAVEKYMNRAKMLELFVKYYGVKIEGLEENIKSGM